MSISCTWTAIRGKDKAAVLRELGLEVAAEQTRNALFGTQMATGWYVITANRYADDPCASMLATLSSGCDVLAFQEVEGVGYQAVAGWTNGSQVWSAVLDASKADLPTLDGMAPDEARGDSFDVLEISQLLTGFRPDEDGPEPSELLHDPRRPAKKSSWRTDKYGP